MSLTSKHNHCALKLTVLFLSSIQVVKEEKEVAGKDKLKIDCWAVYRLVSMTEQSRKDC